MSTKNTSYHYPKDEFLMDHMDTVVIPEEAEYTPSSASAAASTGQRQSAYTLDFPEHEGPLTVDAEVSTEDTDAMAGIGGRAHKDQLDYQTLAGGGKRGVLSATWDKWCALSFLVKVMAVVIVALLVLLPLVRLVSHVFHHSAAQTVAVSMPTTKPQVTVDQEAAQQNAKWLDLKTQLVGDEVSISQLQTQVQQLQTALSQSTASNGELTQKMAQMTAQMNAVKELLSRLQQAKPVSSALSPQTAYQLRAVVAGRAWVEDSNGNSLTAQVGDTLPGYGRVERIDEQAGYVQTSTGQVIRFVARAN